MSQLETQIETKRRELDALKKITKLTGTMKSQLSQLSEQVKDIETDGARVADVMSIWDSVTQSISAAGLGLLRYGEDNYKVGTWGDSNAKSSVDGQDMPLPEGLVRVSTEQQK